MKFPKFLKEYVTDWTLYEKLWLFSFTAINVYLFFAWHDTVLGLVTSLTGMLCVILTAKGRISNFYFGIVNVALYVIISFQSKYYGEALLNLLYFLPMSFAGLYYWYKHENKDKKDTIYLLKIKKSEFALWLLVSALGTAIYGFFLMFLGGTLPFVDASSTVLSITGMILTVRRAKEQWVLWIVEDVIEVGMWVYVFATSGGNVSMIVMWTAYLVNATYGWFKWKKLEKINPELEKNAKPNK